MDILFIDMEACHEITTATRKRAPSRLLNAIVWLALPLLVAATLFTLIYTIGMAGIGGGDLYVQGSTSAVTIEHTTPFGEAVVQDLTEPSDELLALQDGSAQFRFLEATAQSVVSGFGARAVLIAVALVGLAALWVALWNVRGIARSALHGDIFVAANSRRLSRLGATAIAYPLVDWFIGRSVFTSIVSDGDVGVSGFFVDHGIDNRVMWFVVGLLLLTLAQAFTRGVELQQLEAATI